MKGQRPLRAIGERQLWVDSSRRLGIVKRPLMTDIVEKLQNQEVTKNRSNDVLSEDWHSTPRQSRHIGG